MDVVTIEAMVTVAGVGDTSGSGFGSGVNL